MLYIIITIYIIVLYYILVHLQSRWSQMFLFCLNVKLHISHFLKKYKKLLNILNRNKVIIIKKYIK